MPIDNELRDKVYNKNKFVSEISKEFPNSNKTISNDEMTSLLKQAGFVFNEVEIDEDKEIEFQNKQWLIIEKVFGKVFSDRRKKEFESEKN